MRAQMTPCMKIADPIAAQQPPVNEVKLMLAMLPFAGARVLELGCGRAEKTRTLAENGRAEHILALEVDQVQHAKNLQIDDLPNVRFAHGGAEEIPADGDSFDIVIMFKSLHHVRPGAMDAALGEIARVLRPGGLAWISEPVYGGELNEIMRLFHDEKLVREAAFAAVCRAVERGHLLLREELFFSTRSHFADFAQFDARMIRVTHSNHTLSPELYQEVKKRFSAHLTPDGVTLLSPQRVDLLEKPR